MGVLGKVRFSGLNDPDHQFVGAYSWSYLNNWSSTRSDGFNPQLQPGTRALSPQLLTNTSLRLISTCAPRAAGWQWVWWHGTCPSPIENTASAFAWWNHAEITYLLNNTPSVPTHSYRWLKCWVDVMMIFWQPPMEEIEHQFKTQRKGSRNLSLLIPLSVLIWGTLPHSTLIGKSCQKWWCHHHQTHLTLAADCQCWVQVNKSPGTWTHIGVLLQCRHSMIRW